MGLARVTVEERVRAEKNRAVQFVKQRRNNPVVQRRRIKKNINPARHAKKQPEQSEAMEERHRVENPVGVHEVQDGQHLEDVGNEIGVGQFDAFGRAFGTAREKDDRRGFALSWFPTRECGLKVARRSARHCCDLEIAARTSSR